MPSAHPIKGSNYFRKDWKESKASFGLFTPICLQLVYFIHNLFSRHICSYEEKNLLRFGVSDIHMHCPQCRNVICCNRADAVHALE